MSRIDKITRERTSELRIVMINGALPFLGQVYRSNANMTDGTPYPRHGTLGSARGGRAHQSCSHRRLPDDEHCGHCAESRWSVDVGSVAAINALLVRLSTR